MRQALILFIVAAAVAIGAARHFDQSGKAGGDSAMAAKAAVAAAPQQPAAHRTVTLRSDARGQFKAEARVDGRAVDFLVDTGASMIALNEKSAGRLGIFPSASDYTVKTQTANGVGRAARVRLNRVEIDGIAVRDVEAFVIPDNQLSTNLLGMTFLSRVKWTHDRGRLVLEQ